MKYHSKTPEEWEKYDKEKEKRDYIRKMQKRRQRTNNLIIIFISVFAIALIILSKYYFPRYRFGDSLIMDSISFSLMSPNEYTYPDGLSINVNMFNTGSKSKKMKIDSFVFYIYKVTDSSSETFYRFEYPNIIDYELYPLESKKIFDLNLVNPMSKIPNGDYVVEAKFNYNNKTIKLKKQFKYIHSIKYNIYLEKAFYLENEYPKLYIEAKNYSSETKSINLMGKIQIFTQKRKLIKEVPVNLGYITLNSLEYQTFEISIPPVSKGIYELYFVSEELNQAVYIPLAITNNIEKKLKNVSLSIDTYLFYPVNQLFQGDFYINNLDFKKERFLEIEGYNIRLLNIENNTIVYNYENNEKKRIYISEGGKVQIHSVSYIPPVKLSIPGNYKLIFAVKSNENTVERTMDLYVGISQ
ncbi:hypothetical protein SAMN02745164_00616 [Marinitoga hydrogenitolerans DSM 16785]|uniref:Uncharacterized protein n=1 Tax=Marinitoga hydrogenitolerans (strain DSM 16785 / JCM 12826 / AT1271) TaxID=1122195 RepID=A0A1M4U8P8_MARH1|nr:hypothetical protein [Marinitoga hydrogenitolerans]SHE52996.1 hypothetical protein SAMN02745164_00616 [Marinitoga hydrogenitolerans DSM 16785]